MTDALMIPPDTDLDLAAANDEMDERSAVTLDLIANIQSPNIALEMDDDDLARLGSKVVEEYELDLQSRKDAGWEDLNTQAVKMAMQVKEAKTYPWPNAANIKYPLITVAAIQFAARAYPAIVDGWNVVKGKVIGEPSDEKADRAQRISDHMSWQLLEDMEEWESDTDKLLHMLPVVGCMVRKTWFDPVAGRNRTELISPDKFVVDYHAKAELPRATQVVEYYPHQVLERTRSGVWRDIVLDQGADDDALETFLEQHRLWDLDGDGYPEPYIVTVHKEQGRVVRLVARYDEDGVVWSPTGQVVRIEPVKYFTKYSFIPSLDGSWYDIGFGTLLNSLNETINATINQLLDAGHLANTQGGFIGSGVSMKSGNASFKPGEWKKVTNEGGSLKDNIVPLPVAGPSTVLFSLLGMMVEAAKDITATKDILTGETQGSNQAVGTTLAMIEQGLKVFTAIYKRIHRCLKQELGCLYRLNRLYLDPQVYFEFQDKQGVVAQDDYSSEDVDVVPVSDPTVVSDMQRIARAQFLMQFLGKGMDDKEIINRVLGAASIPDVKGLWPKEEPPNVEAMKAAAEAEVAARELAIKEKDSDAGNAKTLAEAQKTTLETIMAAPGLFEAIAAIVRQEMSGGQEGIRGMEGQSVDGAGAGGPQVAVEGAGAPMGGGGDPFAGQPGQGEDIGGVAGPQL